MKQYIVDAFTDKVFSGNPAAVCVMKEWLPDALMQKIAAENNLKIEYRFAPRREGDIVTCYADASKAFKELGWRAEKTLSDMVRDSYEWQRKLEEV